MPCGGILRTMVYHTHGHTFVKWQPLSLSTHLVSWACFYHMSLIFSSNLLPIGSIFSTSFNSTLIPVSTSPQTRSLPGFLSFPHNQKNCRLYWGCFSKVSSIFLSLFITATITLSHTQFLLSGSLKWPQNRSSCFHLGPFNTFSTQHLVTF